MFLKWIFWLVMILMYVLFFVMIFDCCCLGRWYKMYLVIFVMFIVWIVGLFYIMVWMVMVVGKCVYGIWSFLDFFGRVWNLDRFNCNYNFLGFVGGVCKIFLIVIVILWVFLVDFVKYYKLL